MWQKTQTLDSLQFTKLAMVRKLLARAKTLDTYKKFVMVLGDSKANRLDALIRAGLKRGVGIHGMLDLLVRRPVHAERGEHATRGLNRCVNHT